MTILACLFLSRISEINPWKSSKNFLVNLLDHKGAPEWVLSRANDSGFVLYKWDGGWDVYVY